MVYKNLFRLNILHRIMRLNSQSNVVSLEGIVYLVTKNLSFYLLESYL